jgi:hypothetical protein
MLILKKVTVNFAMAMAVLCTANAFAAGDKVVIEFYPDTQVTEKKNPVNLSFSGKMYKGRPLLRQVNLRGAKQLAVEAALGKFIEVNASGTADQVVELWNPVERQSIKEMISKGDIFTRNRALFAAITESRLVARLNYGSFILFYVEHERSPSQHNVSLYTFTEKDGRYFATNALSKDFFYSQIAFDLPRYFDQGRIQK